MTRQASRPSPERLRRRAVARPTTVSLWDRHHRRFTVVRASDTGAEMVAPADVVALGDELVLGIGFAGGDIFATVRVVSIAPGRTHPLLARIRVHWRKFSGTDPELTRRFFKERLGLTSAALGAPPKPTPSVRTVMQRRYRSRPLASRSRQIYASRPARSTGATSGRERIPRNTRP